MEGISLRNICKVYSSTDKKRVEGVKAVDNFNMEIEGNEFIVFVGPSGCGKSTTLRMIAGLEKITSGELYIDGKYVNDTEPKDRDIAMVFQNYALYPHMTAYKNIAFGLTLRKNAIPVFEKNSETEEKLATIDALEAKIKMLHKKVLSAEKKLDPLERKYANQKVYLQSIQEEMAALNGRKAKTKKVQNQLIKLNRMLDEVVKTCQAQEQQIGKLEESIAANRTAIADHKKMITQLRTELAPYQKKAIDKKAISACKKNVSYYKKLAAKDDRRRKQDTDLLAAKRKELAEVEVQLSGTSQKDAVYALELKRAAIEDEISFIQEELSILDTRKQTLDREIKSNEEKAVYYEKEPQPIFLNRTYTKEEIDSKIKTAADILDIKKLLNRKPREMSGGQRQRIALGRAIVREPKVFLLDEPLSNLDAKLRASMRVEISKLHEKLKTTFIYVTHDQVEAMTMGTRIVVMKDGVVQQIDTPTNLFDYPDNVFVAGFIGTPQMNFFPVNIMTEDGQLQVSFADGTVLYFPLEHMRKLDKAYCDGKSHSCVLGIRGEDISIAEDGLPAKVSMVEVLGNETHIHMSADAMDAGKEIIANLRQRVSYQSEDSLHLRFSGEKIHLFDAENQKRILDRPL